MAAHNPKCIKRADVYFKCKEKWTTNKTTNHLWVKGNLTHNLVCSHCHEEVDYHGSPGIFGIRCCWCQKSFHDDCYKNYYGDDIKTEKCDFGEFKNLIYPPSSIVAARTPGAVRLHLTEVKKPENIENWCPLVVITNTKSGSNTATEVMSLLKGYLNPIQVMEISNKGPSEALKLAIKSCPTHSKILVAGGDGTVGWVLNTIKQMTIQPHPSVAILPLGTGNDLSRVLGWGSEPPSTLDPLNILRSVQNANSIKMDCFDMMIKQHKRLSLPKKSFSNKYQIYNYFSIGVDALVTYNFHKTRESRFYLLSSRLFNKMIYFGYGTQQIIQRDCEGLHDNLDLYIDDKLIELPDLQSIVLLNIDSWGAGCKLVELSNSCDIDDRIEHSISDGMMEVFGVASSFHVAQLQVKLSKPIRLGQGRNIKVNCFIMFLELYNDF